MANYALVVGISKYQDVGIRDLKYSENDADKIAEALQTLKFTVRKLLGSEATYSEVNGALAGFLTQITEHDTFVFFFAGHGCCVRSVNYLDVYDSDQEHINTSVNVSEWLDRFESGNCQRITFFVDACHSGSPTANMSRDGQDELNVEIFERKLKSATHCALFAACKLREKSYESPEFQHGIWTWYLIRALSGHLSSRYYVNKILTSTSLQDYLSTEVPPAAAKFGLQSPVLCGQHSNEFIVADLRDVLDVTPKTRDVKLEFKSKPIRLCKLGEVLNSYSWDPDYVDLELSGSEAARSKIRSHALVRKNVLRSALRVSIGDIHEESNGLRFELKFPEFRYVFEVDVEGDDLMLTECLCDLKVGMLGSAPFEKALSQTFQIVQIRFDLPVSPTIAMKKLEGAGVEYTENVDSIEYADRGGTLTIRSNAIEWTAASVWGEKIVEMTPMLGECVQSLERTEISALIDLGCVKSLM